MTKAQVREIAEKKMKDLNCDTVEAAMKHGRGLGPLDGPGGGGVTDHGNRKTFDEGL